MNELAGECERKRRELSDKLTQELSKMSIGSAKAKVSLDSTIPWAKVGGGILSGVGGFILARGASFVFPPLGVALTVIGILGAVFGDSTEKKIKENKEKIRGALTEPSHDALKEIHDELKKVFNEKIWKEGVCDFWDLLAKYQFMLARLGKSQYELAAKLFGKFTDLNFELLREAAIYKNAEAAQVSYIPRIPGETMVVLATRSNLDAKKISELLGEKVLVVKPEKNFYETLKNILGVEFQIKSYRLALDTEEKKAEYFSSANLQRKARNFCTKSRKNLIGWALTPHASRKIFPTTAAKSNWFSSGNSARASRVLSKCSRARTLKSARG